MLYGVVEMGLLDRRRAAEKTPARAAAGRCGCHGWSLCRAATNMPQDGGTR